MIDIKKFIKENSDFNYAEFNKKFITSKYPILGVRVPLLRKFAREIEPEFIDLNGNLTHEEILLYGFSACNFKNEQLEYLQNIIPYIDNWATCDCIVQSMKQLNTDDAYNFFVSLLHDNREFFVRVGVVGLMRHFITSDKIEQILKEISTIKSDAYYVKMAVAWFNAELAGFNFALAKEQIRKTSDKFIRNKSISKARESRRLTKEQKDELANLRI